MKTYSYLDTVNFAATVCDREGIVLYQNGQAIKRDGDVTGQNLYGCHGEEAGRMIRHMIETGSTNTYQTIHNGKHNLIHQTPWYDECGVVAGLIELDIDLPDNMPVRDRDAFVAAGTQNSGAPRQNAAPSSYCP